MMLVLLLLCATDRGLDLTCLDFSLAVYDSAF